jgi:hypothetical protein
MCFGWGDEECIQNFEINLAERGDFEGHERLGGKY